MDITNEKQNGHTVNVRGKSWIQELGSQPHNQKCDVDVFKAFKDHKGNFKECLYKDVKGMLSLYEASRLAFEEEYVIDEAFLFTRMNLMDLQGVSNLEESLLEQVIHALELPLHRRMSTLQEDLKEMTRWWIGMGLSSKLNFARDRLMECFFWSVGMVSEPQFRNCRKSFTKVASFATIIDDVYNVYGTFAELELFTEDVQRFEFFLLEIHKTLLLFSTNNIFNILNFRWDLCALKDLPKCMELCFLALYNSVNEMAYETLRDLGENIIPYLTKAWADLCKAFLKEAEWARSKHVPTFQDYLETAWSSNITSEALDSLERYHDILRWPSTIFRLCNDLVTSKVELERGESANSIICYMKEVGCSEATARQHISDLIDNYWMKMNKCRIEGSPFAKHLVETATNLARISQCIYQHGDAHGCPDNLSKNRIQSLIVDPISIN
ncbi:hypothetical protein PVK06_012816 [Gossypium arboreum]|uniref:(+)-delta-cadinene synthase n=1 Tax=Gossypium arboreum TaxID=29729 RepID=A0ABR0QCG9_GOSAR|nr:hypothetical protein PVK06_012816 [Gossypium arboreum]